MSNTTEMPIVKELLKMYGKTMADLSREAGVSYSSLNHYLNGYMEPGKKALEKITTQLSQWEDEHSLKQGLAGLNIQGAPNDDKN